VNQSKNCGGPADSQSQRKHGRDGENGRQPELPHDVTQIAEQVLHDTPHPVVGIRWKQENGSRLFRGLLPY
jgi:hypothetical protein